VAWVDEGQPGVRLWAAFDSGDSCRDRQPGQVCIMSLWDEDERGEPPVIEGAQARVWEAEALAELRGELSAPRARRAA
jgi:hypothetical protein